MLGRFSASCCATVRRWRSAIKSCQRWLVLGLLSEPRGRRAAMAAATAEELTAIQRRCRAVLQGGRAGEELKAAAALMLRTGEPSRRARTAGGLCGSESASSTLDAQLIKNAAPKKTARAAAGNGPHGAGSAVSEAASVIAANGWSCVACTLRNGARAARCAACGEPRAKSLKTKSSRPNRAVPDDFDADDADAFALPVGRRAPAARGGVAGTSAAAPVVVDLEPEPQPVGEDDSDEWET